MAKMTYAEKEEIAAAAYIRYPDLKPVEEITLTQVDATPETPIEAA